MKRTVCTYCQKVMIDNDSSSRFRCRYCGEFMENWQAELHEKVLEALGHSPKQIMRDCQGTVEWKKEGENMSYDFNGFAQPGWQCPICKRVFSPFTPMCYYCNQKGDEVTNTVSQLYVFTNNCKKCGKKFWSTSAQDICPSCGTDQD